MKKVLLVFFTVFLLSNSSLAQQRPLASNGTDSNMEKLNRTKQISSGFSLIDLLPQDTQNKDFDVINNSKNPNLANTNGNPYNSNRSPQEVEKCGTVESMNRLRAKYPEWESIDEFESWMQQKIIAKQMAGANHSSPTHIDGAEITVPYVVHIIHDGTPINSVGNIDGNNISATQVESQIKVINEDFNKENADRANSPQWDDVAAAIGIRFAPVLYHPETGIPLEEPGIHRVDRNEMGFTAPPYGSTYIDNTIKPATSWNWETTVNIWVMELTGGLYGYAQFPSSSLPGMPTNGGASNTDGVVIGDFTFGSSVDDDGSFTTDNGQLGRTLTHELGHWVGLRHVWGDGDCSADDYVQDTPPQNGNSPFGQCNSGQNTCDDTQYGYTTDLDDMKENFMDYSSDACMNLFTLDQLDRAEVVFDDSPGRGVLIDADSDEYRDPMVFFAESAINQTNIEALGCALYTDYELAIRVAYDYTGTSDVVATVSAAGTAVEGEDFDFVGDNFVNFSGGAQDMKIVTVRVYNDAITEGDESIEFTLSLDAGDTNVVLTDNESYSKTTWTITDSVSEDKPVISLIDESTEPVVGTPSQIGLNASVSESSDCDSDYSDYYIVANIDNCALGESEVEVNIVIDSGTAVEGEDFDFVNGKTFTFNGDKEQEIQVLIRTYNDGDVEDTESFTFHLELTNSDLAELDASTTTNVTILDTNTPLIKVLDMGIVDTEGPYACEGSTIVPIRLEIGGCLVPNETIEVTASANDASTATEGEDYVITTPSVSFDIDNLTGEIMVELLNDLMVEGDEVLELDLTVSQGATGLTSETVIITIEDNLGNRAPSYSVGLSSDFESGSLDEDWILLKSSANTINDFVFGENSDLNGTSLHISNDLSTLAYEYSNSIGFGSTEGFFLLSPLFSLGDSSPLDFAYQVQGEAGFFGAYDYGDFGIVSASADVTNFNEVLLNFTPNTLVYLLFRPDGTTIQSEIAGYDLAADLGSATNGQPVRLAFYWENDNSVIQNPPLAIDDIQLDNVFVGNGIQSPVMIGSEIPSYPIISGEESYYYHETSENIALSINSTSDHGCSSGYVASEGAYSIPLISDKPQDYISAKTFILDAEHEDKDAELEVSLYYTEAELAGWEKETGLSRSDANMFKMYDYNFRSCYENPIKLTITFDNYPTETSWEIVAGDGTVVQSGSGYTSPGATIEERFDLPNGDYEFRIKDSYGDGICCFAGNGSYTLTSGLDEIASGGDYGREESTSFCVSATPERELCNDYSEIDFSPITFEPYANGYKLTASFSTGLGESTTFGIGGLPIMGSGEFTAEQHQETINITYENKFDESNIDYYIFEKRDESTLDFVELQTISQSGKNTYTIVDYFPYHGINEYRVATVLKSGEIIYSCAMAFVNYIPTDEFKINPNPVVDVLTVILSDAKVEGALNFDIYDVRGRLIHTQQVNSSTGVTRYDLDVSNLAGGQYYLQVRDDSGYQRTEPFVKVVKN